MGWNTAMGNCIKHLQGWRKLQSVTLAASKVISGRKIITKIWPNNKDVNIS